MKKIYLIVLFLFVAMVGVYAQKGREGIALYPTPIMLDTTKINDVTTEVVIADGGESVSEDMWFIGDGDPSGWSISKGEYDSELDSYVTILEGNRKEDDDNNTNSFYLWYPSDSGMVWNVSSPIVTFKVKIMDGQDYKREQAAGNLDIYFWVTIKDKDGLRSAKVRYTADKEGPYLPTNEWWNYTPTGLGEDLADGKWHTDTVNLRETIQTYRDSAAALGDADAGGAWKFYGIECIEIRTLKMAFDDVKVLPDSTVTKVTDISRGGVFHIYPNPSYGDLYVDSGRGTGKVSVKVYDLTGRLRKEYDGLGSQAKLMLNDLARGVYFLKITDGQRNEVKKVILK